LQNGVLLESVSYAGSVAWSCWRLHGWLYLIWNYSLYSGVRWNQDS